MDNIEIAAKILSASGRIAVLTGAGISTSAGIPDFRGPNGLYRRKDIPAELLFDIDYFRKDPSLFYTHIFSLWESLRKALPTKAHFYLADLGKRKQVDIITQNIDSLHEKAESASVIPLHGDFKTFSCLSCGKKTSETDAVFQTVSRKEIPGCPHCGKTIKPSVVFFGEQVLYFTEAEKAMQRADCILVIGSSLQVYPAASLPRSRKEGAKLIIINRDATYLDKEADCVIRNDIDTAAEMLIE